MNHTAAIYQWSILPIQRGTNFVLFHSYNALKMLKISTNIETQFQRCSSEVQKSKWCREKWVVSKWHAKSSSSCVASKWGE